MDLAKYYAYEKKNNLTDIVNNLHFKFVLNFSGRYKEKIIDSNKKEVEVGLTRFYFLVAKPQTLFNGYQYSC